MLKRICFYNLFEMEQLQLKVKRCASSEIKQRPGLKWTSLQKMITNTCTRKPFLLSNLNNSNDYSYQNIQVKQGKKCLKLNTGKQEIKIVFRQNILKIKNK